MEREDPDHTVSGSEGLEAWVSLELRHLKKYIPLPKTLTFRKDLIQFELGILYLPPKGS